MVTEKPAREKLTKRFVDNTDTAGYYRDTELPGFCLRVCVGKTGKISKYYIVNTKPRGSRKNVTVSIGKVSVIGIEQARSDAKTILGQLAQGVNPNDHKKIEIATQRKKVEKEKIALGIHDKTLQKLLGDYLLAHKLRDRTAKDYGRVIHRCLGDWLELPITAITKDMVQTRHVKLSKEHPAQANLTMRILRALFKYAMAVYEDADGKQLLTHNPVDRLKDARMWNRIPRRQSVIRPHELAGWYQAVLNLPNEVAADVLLVELFTGLRHSEACSLRWKNIDFKALTIKIEDTKNHDDHMLPMSRQLQAVLRKRFDNRTSFEYVFPSARHGTKHVADIRDSIECVIRQSGVRFTEHDLRRTFETTAESLDISYYSLKRLLNHRISGDPTSGYIVSSAERLRDAAQKVADYLAHHMEPASPKSDESNREHDSKSIVPFAEAPMDATRR